jgi:hypothetical protein
VKLCGRVCDTRAVSTVNALLIGRHGRRTSGWARARIAKDHEFPTWLVDQLEEETIAGVAQTCYD